LGFLEIQHTKEKQKIKNNDKNLINYFSLHIQFATRTNLYSNKCKKLKVKVKEVGLILFTETRSSFEMQAEA